MHQLQIDLYHIAAALGAIGAFLVGVAALLALQGQRTMIVEIHEQTNGTLATVRAELAVLKQIETSLLTHDHPVTGHTIAYDPPTSTEHGTP